MISEATRRGVALWQVTAYETQGPNGTQIGFFPAVPLNPQIFPKGTWLDPYVPVPPSLGAPPATLGPASSGGAPLQPDPVIVQ